MRAHPWDPSPSDRRGDPSTRRGWRRLGRGDPLLWLGIAGLAALGILNLVGVGDPSEAQHQLATVVLGAGVALLLSRLRMRVWVVLGRLAYAAHASAAHASAAAAAAAAATWSAAAATWSAAAATWAAAACAAGTRTTGSPGVTGPPLRVRRAKAERTISHLSVLSGRMEGS